MATFGVGFGTNDANCINGGNATNLSGNGCVGYLMNGNLVIGNNTPNAILSYTTGTILSFAWDLSAHKVWARAGCAGLWNNNGSANPGTGVGGFGIVDGVDWLAGISFVAMVDGFNGNANGATLNNGSVAFACTPIPSGFVRW